MTMSTGKKKRTGAGLVLMILGLALIVTGTAAALGQRTNLFEYAAPAPAPSGDTTARTRLEELGGLIPEYEWCAALRTQNAEASTAAGARMTVTLYAVSEGYFDLHHETPESGRLLTPDDIRSGRAAAVINQSCARELFPGADAVGQTLTYNGREMTVAGVTKSGFRPGETTDAVVWIPMAQADTGNRQETAAPTLEIRAAAPTQAQSAGLKNILGQWLPGGTAWEYGRLRMTVLMPLWLIGAAAGLQALKRLIILAIGKGKELYRGLRERLKNRYPGQMKARLAGAGLLAIAAGAALAGLAYLYLRYLMIPLHTFTDWIPGALVDPNAIIATGKALLAGASGAAVYRTADSAALGLYATWTTCGCLLLCAGGCIRLLARRRGKEELPTD